MAGLTVGDGLVFGKWTRIFQGGVLLGALLVAGCAQTQMTPEAETGDAVQFTQQMAIDYSPGILKFKADLSNDLTSHNNGIATYATTFYPESAGYNGVVQAYQKYCQDKGGRFDSLKNGGNLACLDGQGQPSFVASLTPNKDSLGRSTVTVQVMQPDDQNGRARLLDMYQQAKSA
jgi:hypothetical protein